MTRATYSGDICPGPYHSGGDVMSGSYRLKADDQEALRGLWSDEARAALNASDGLAYAAATNLLNRLAAARIAQARWVRGSSPFQP